MSQSENWGSICLLQGDMNSMANITKEKKERSQSASTRRGEVGVGEGCRQPPPRAMSSPGPCVHHHVGVDHPRPIVSRTRVTKAKTPRPPIKPYFRTACICSPDSSLSRPVPMPGGYCLCPLQCNLSSAGLSEIIPVCTKPCRRIRPISLTDVASDHNRRAIIQFSRC